MNIQTQMLMLEGTNYNSFQEVKIAKKMCKVGFVASLGLFLIGLAHKNLPIYERSFILISSCFVALASFNKFCFLKEIIKKIESFHPNHKK